MVSSTRARIALAALLGIFLIPLVTSSLNGLTHVLTCTAETPSTFTIEAPDNQPPVILSAITVSRDDDTTLCGGLTLNMGVRKPDEAKVELIVPITNNTKFPWRGSVKLVLDGQTVPIDIGEIAPGGTETATVLVKVDPGHHEIDGTLLIGP
jgi:hypothetical protein